MSSKKSQKFDSVKNATKKFFKNYRRGLYLLIASGALIGFLLITFRYLLLSEIIPPEFFGEDDPFLLGEYYFNQDEDPRGQYDLTKARHYYEEAIKENNQYNSLVWYQLGRIDFLEGDFGSAIYKFKKQVYLFGDSVPNVHYMLGLTYGYKARSNKNESDWVKAEESFKKYLELDPESPWARVDLTWVYFSEGKYEEMVPVLEDGIELYPQNPWLLNMYGLSLLNLNQKDKAHEFFIKARDEASRLSAEEWGYSYPGNDPGLWQQGLDEFRSLIQKNIDLTEA